VSGFCSRHQGHDAGCRLCNLPEVTQSDWDPLPAARHVADVTPLGVLRDLGKILAGVAVLLGTAALYGVLTALGLLALPVAIGCAVVRGLR
jgi:hypothetical protein